MWALGSTEMNESWGRMVRTDCDWLAEPVTMNNRTRSFPMLSNSQPRLGDGSWFRRGKSKYVKPSRVDDPAMSQRSTFAPTGSSAPCLMGYGLPPIPSLKHTKPLRLGAAKHPAISSSAITLALNVSAMESQCVGAGILVFSSHQCL